MQKLDKRNMANINNLNKRRRQQKLERKAIAHTFLWCDGTSSSNNRYNISSRYNGDKKYGKTNNSVKLPVTYDRIRGVGGKTKGKTHETQNTNGR